MGRLSQESTSRLSITYRVLKRLNIIGNQDKYGKISLWGLFKLLFQTIWRRLIFNYAFKSMLLEPINKKKVRPLIWRNLGCKVGTNVMIGHLVRLDFGNAELIEVGNNVVISNNATLLCHKRDITQYSKNIKSFEIPFKYEKITIEDYAQIGLNCVILPGVNIGKGAIVGAASVVTKDVPAWSVVAGNPARVIKLID